MSKRFIWFLLFLTILFPLLSLAQVQPPFNPPPPMQPPPPPQVQDPTQLIRIYQSMQQTWDGMLAPFGNDIFYSLALLDMSLFGWRLWRSGGDLRATMSNVVNKVLMMSLFWLLLYNGSSWMFWIIDSFSHMGQVASGVPGLGPSVLLAQGFAIFGPLLWQAVKSGLLLDYGTSIALILAGAVICVSFLVITIQFVMTKVQMFLALGFAKVFLAFGGSKWTTNYVERYFAFSFATGIKLMALYMLAGAAWPLTQGWIQRAQQFSIFSAAGVQTAWLIACAAVIYGVLVVSASSTVSALLGGSPNLTHTDVISFMGPAVGAGMAAGMAGIGIATAGAGLIAAAPAAGGAMAAGAAAKGAGAAGGAAGAGAAAAGGAGGVSPTGAVAPQVAASGGASGGGGGSKGGMATAGRIAGQAGQGVQSAGRAISGGSGHHPPPSFNGFGHGH